jgi:TonB family protein
MRLAAAIRKRLAPFLIVSAALHLVISLFLLLVPRHVQTRVVEQPAMKIYPAALLFAGGTKAEWTPAPPGRKKHFAETKQTASDLTVNAQLAPAKGAPVSAPESTAAGNGADQSNADPAFPVFSPRPPVADRSLLPDSNREVVVDVKVSAAGDVLEATLVKGLGNNLDQIVLDTVKTWRFHPATVNGNAVATEAELIFPFNLSYPTSPS